MFLLTKFVGNIFDYQCSKDIVIVDAIKIGYDSIGGLMRVEI